MLNFVPLSEFLGLFFPFNFFVPITNFQKARLLSSLGAFFRIPKVKIPKYHKKCLIVFFLKFRTLKRQITKYSSKAKLLANFPSSVSTFLTLRVI